MIIRTLIFLLIFLSLTPIIAQDESSDETLDEAHGCVSVWYPSSEVGGGMDTIRANINPIDEVNPFWYTPAADGGILAVDVAENSEELAEWRAAGLRVMPSIFASVPDVIRTDRRSAHISAIVETVIRMDYDGIDIDYEGFPADSRDDFSAFVEDLSAALHAEGKRLSVTVHAKTDDEGAWEGARAQDWVRLSAAADEFKIMTYDYTSRNEPPGPISPTAWVLDVLAYAQTVLPLDRVRIGIPFYGYTWQRGTPPATTTAWISVQTTITNLNLTVERDPSGEAFVDFKVAGLPRQVIYFSEAEGLRLKLEQVYAAYPDLGGVSIWGIGGEDPHMWDVLGEFVDC